MNKTLVSKGSGMRSVVPVRRGGISTWQRWAPYGAVVWSLAYSVMGIYWAVSGLGFPYTPEAISDALGPLLGRFGPGMDWIVVVMAGLPAAVLGVAMLRGVRGKLLRPLIITAGLLLVGALLLLMTGLNLLVLVGYIPAALLGRFTAERSQAYLQGWTQWATIHQLLCLVGGFLWMGATACYARRSVDACVYCGRRDGPEGWTSPEQAARWVSMVVYMAMVVPFLYAFTRYAWALGFPLGMSEAYLRQGQESGTWISGLFLATFGLVGALLMLGLVQRWGEVFPRWMIVLAGRRVPIALAVIPASLVSVLLIVGGIGVWSDLNRMVAAWADGGAESLGSLGGVIIFQLGPTLLFPVWGIALAVAALGYYYRRRGPCTMCGRGASFRE